MWLSAGAAWSYVLPAPKVLQRWTRTRSAALAGPVQLPVRWGGRDGWLYAAGPGASALAVSGEPTAFDPGPGAGGTFSALWRAVDVFASSNPEELRASLEAAGIDFSRAGYARALRSEDGVAHTVGARGEGEGDLPQVLFSRRPLWPLTVRLHGWESVEVGPPGPGGWPAWLQVADGRRLEFTGPPVDAREAPPWARRPLDFFPSGEGFPDWRRAFGEPRP